MLREAACMLDKAACAYIFQGERHRKGMTIEQLDHKAHSMGLSDTQMARWETFSRFMQRKGWSVSDAMVTSGVMKELGKGNNGQEENRMVTLAQLESWAEQEAEAEVVDDCRELLQLVATFGDGVHPLVLGQVVQVVDAAPCE